MKTKFFIILLLYFFISNIFAQHNWELVSNNPQEGFRFYNSSNGFAAIFDETHQKLISYHSSAFSGLIVRLITDVRNNHIDSQELNWINPDSPMRGGGFDIQKFSNNDYFLFGIGTLKDTCYDYIGATIFAKKLNPTGQITWNDVENPIFRKNVFLSGFNSRQNNGIADGYGNYYFCNAGTNQHLYVINLFDNSGPVDLSSNFSDQNYIIEFKKIYDGVNLHIIGIENNRENFIYIRINQSGQYFITRYSFNSVTNTNNVVSLQSETSFDLGLYNQNAEFMFFTKDKRLYSINLSQNAGNSLRNKAILKYQADPSDIFLLTKLDRIRGLIYIENGKCLLVPYNYSHFYFNGQQLIEDTQCNINARGVIVDKIYKLNNIYNSKVFVTRQHQDFVYDQDFKRIRLFTIDSVNTYSVFLEKYEPPLNNYLISTNFTHGGGARVRSLAITNNHLLYDGWDRVNYKNINSSSLIDDSKYLNLNLTTLIPINNDEFVGGLYYGPFVQRFKIVNNRIFAMDIHKIVDDFKKIFSSAFDDENVYFGLYHNGQSSTNISNIYKYNLQHDSTNNNIISSSFLSIDNTNFVPSLKVIIDNANKKWLYGIAQNVDNGVYKIFRKNLTDNLQMEEVSINLNGIIRDMEIINGRDNKQYLYFITNNRDGGSLFKIKISDNNLSASNIHLMRRFNQVPINIISFLDKHLIIAFKCKKIGYLTQDDNSYILEFEEMPLPVDYMPNTFVANEFDKSLYLGARGGIGNNYSNNDGGIYKILLPSYLGFSYQFIHNWEINPDYILSGDINGDGYDDLISITKTGQLLNWSIKINDTNNNFNFFSSFKLASSNSDFVFVGDFNGDGFDDLGVNRISDPVSVQLGEWIIFLNDGQGHYSSSRQFRFHWGMIPDKISIGDYNGDGFDDIAIFKNNDGWYIKLNNRSFGFVNNFIKYDWINMPDFIFSGDFNGDGYDDIGVKNSNSSLPQWVIRFNDHSINFVDQKRYVWNINPSFVGIGDFNNDSLSDICSIVKILDVTSSHPFLYNIYSKWIFKINYGYYYEHTNTVNRLSNLQNNDEHNDVMLQIYPNPTFHNITVRSNSSINIVELRTISNPAILLRKEINYKKQFDINLSGFPPNVYLLTIYLDNGQIKNRYIIKN